MLLTKIYSIFFSAVNLVLCTPCVGLLPTITIYFFYYKHAQMNSYQHQILLRFYTNPLVPDNERLLRGSNPIPHPEHLYLSKITIFS